jgi:outer membrane lipoprotein-sorting protein
MRKLFVSVCLMWLGVPARAQDVATILQRMNAAAPSFHTMSADMRLVTFTAVISDTLTEDGTLKMQRVKDGSIRAVMDFSSVKESAREIGLFGKTVRMYFPNAKYYKDYEFGKNGNLINQFLLLGFGASGDELSKSYTISAAGTEKIAGVTTTKLVLIPKDEAVKEKLAKAELWIPDGQSSPIQQEFYEEPSGNYRKVSYTNLRMNPSFKGRLEIQMPSDTPRRN